MADALFNEVVKNPVGPIEPIPLQYLEEGLRSQEANTQKAQADFQDRTSSILNMTPVSQGDAEVLQKARQALTEGLKNVDISDLSNPQNRSRINSIISQVSNNPDVLAVAQRSASFRKMKDEKDKAEAQGKEYINPGWDDAVKYQQQGLYIKNKQFNSDGWIAPDIAKLMSEIEKTVPERIDANGNKYKDPEQLKTMLDVGIKSTPNALKTLQYQFAQNTGSVDWKNAATSKVAQDYKDAQDLINNSDVRLQHLIHNGGTKEDINAVIGQKQAALAKANEYKSMLDNPYSSEAIRQKYEKDYIDDQINKFTKASTYHNESDPALEKLKEEAVAHSNRMIELKYKEDAITARQEAKLHGADVGADGKIPIMDEYYAIKNGKQNTSIYADPSGWGGDNAAGMHDKFTPKQLATSFDIKGVTAPEGGDAWKPANVSPAIKSALANKISTTMTSGEDYSSSTVVNQNIDNVFVDSKGNLGYIYTGSGGNKMWGTISEDGLKATIIAKGTQGSAKGKDFYTKAVTNYKDPYSISNAQIQTKQSIPTPTQYQHAAKLGNDTIYSNDGKIWYNKQGQKIK